MAFVFKYTYWKIAVVSLILGVAFLFLGFTWQLAVEVTAGYLIGFAIFLAVVVVVKMSTQYARTTFTRSRYAEISERGIMISADNGSESLIAWSDLLSVNW